MYIHTHLQTYTYIHEYIQTHIYTRAYTNTHLYTSIQNHIRHLLPLVSAYSNKGNYKRLCLTISNTKNLGVFPSSLIVT